MQLRHTAPSPSDPANFALTGLNRDEFTANMATPYERRGSRVVRSEYAIGFSSAAGLISSAHDMATFASAIDQGMFLEPATWQAVFTPAVSNGGSLLPYGLGWFIQQRRESSCSGTTDTGMPPRPSSFEPPRFDERSS